MKQASSYYQQAILQVLSPHKVSEGNIEQHDGNGLANDAIVHKEQPGHEHIEAHLGDVFVILVDKPKLSHGDDETGDQNYGIRLRGDILDK